MSTKIAFILTAKNLHDTKRIGASYNIAKDSTEAFSFEKTQGEKIENLLIKKITELTGFLIKKEDITIHGEFIDDVTQGEENKTILCSVCVNKIDGQRNEDEFQAREDAKLRWTGAQEAAESSDWRMPLTIMKIITSKKVQIVINDDLVDVE
jgi:hypothetical protein